MQYILFTYVIQRSAYTLYLLQRLGCYLIIGWPTGALLLFKVPRCASFMRRYDLTKFELRVITPLAPNKTHMLARLDGRHFLNNIFWMLQSRLPRARFVGTLRPLHHPLEPLPSLDQSWLL